MYCEICHEILGGLEQQNKLCVCCADQAKEAAKEMDIEWEHDYAEGLIHFPLTIEIDPFQNIPKK